METGQVEKSSFEKLCRNERQLRFATGRPARQSGRNDTGGSLCRYVVTDRSGNPAPEDPSQWALRPCGSAFVTELCYHLGSGSEKLNGCHIPVSGVPTLKVYEVGRGTFALPGEIITGVKANGRIETVGQHGLVRKATVKEDGGEKFADVSGVRVEVDGIEGCAVDAVIQISFQPSFENYEDKENCGTWCKSQGSLQIRLCVTNQNIQAGGSGAVTIWDDTVSPPVATSEIVEGVVLDWMHGGSQISAGRQAAIIAFGGVNRFMWAECE